ncbi:dTMP kinase [Mycoplasma sp. NEAQ87857]|uniref:dTMP kinase n=1 Tax=Mycoplasma sp. NEAQ87857 TaxID=2683967 RepID=UPI001317B105|nr:dTMP kinase [Mycoplasma sp. NEAQ87857]QGZ97897.1 dTMP kinase [Mycoplasma sp. NEAQ87857]
MFISFEGLDGSGKTTIIGKVSQKLIKDYPFLNIVSTREPGGKDIKEAEKIREIILDPNSLLSPVAEALLYTTSRRIHLERVIWPALAKNEVVLCDRYVDSFYAYQGFARNLGYRFVKDMTHFAIEKTMPDITIFFEITPEETLMRRESNRLIKDRLENEELDFHHNVYEGYHQIIEEDPNRFVIVDANLTIDQVFDQVYNQIINHPKFKEYLANLNVK